MKVWSDICGKFIEVPDEEPKREQKILVGSIGPEILLPRAKFTIKKAFEDFLFEPKDD